MSLYEPIHGSAPDIAGRGHRQPLRHHPLGGHDARPELRPARPRRAPSRAAVETALDGGARTADIAAAGEPALTTDEMTDRVIAAL